VILSAAIWVNYLTLLVVATYVIAPLPNWLCERCANPDDFMESSGSAIIDFGRWLTGFLVLMGIGMLYLNRDFYQLEVVTLSLAKLCNSFCTLLCSFFRRLPLRCRQILNAH